ncbi:MAG TPA: hypothetical protein VIS29_18050, partial [Streptomyces sp.]
AAVVLMGFAGVASTANASQTVAAATETGEPSESSTPIVTPTVTATVTQTATPSPTPTPTRTHRPRPPHHGHGNASDLAIGLIGYNATGPDVATNRNQEYVDISNVGRHTVDVAGLVLEDSWARAHHGDNPRGCNTYTITGLDGGTTALLPARHTVRIYTGSGIPVSFGVGHRMHALYMDSHCGFHGHFWNNLGDTAYVTLNARTLTKPFDFHHGYWVR